MLRISKASEKTVNHIRVSASNKVTFSELVLIFGFNASLAFYLYSRL